MKWYFALSETSIDRVDHDWRGLIKVAVQSARQHTSLQPCMLYDGQENGFLDELRRMGVSIIHHRVSFYENLVEIEKERPGYLAIASGTFMRVDLPLIEQEDEFIFYTDCDVTFLAEPDLAGLRPAYFAAAPQASQTDYDNDMNAGVMVINIPAMRAVRPWFIDFITANLRAGWPGFDQENYRRFFKGKWSRLPLGLNWKPYWGVTPDVQLVHWHGPKPDLVRKLIANPEMETVGVWKNLFSRNSEGYRHFLQLWEQCAATLPIEIDGHMDMFSARGAAGWALYCRNERAPVDLRIWIDGEPVGEVRCSQPRRDIAALYGLETAGFQFTIPARFQDGSTHELELRDSQGGGVFLKYQGKPQQKYVFRA